MGVFQITGSFSNYSLSWALNKVAQSQIKAACSGLGLAPCAELSTILELIPAPHTSPPLQGGIRTGHSQHWFQPHGRSTGQSSQFTVPALYISLVLPLNKSVLSWLLSDTLPPQAVHFWGQVPLWNSSIGLQCAVMVTTFLAKCPTCRKEFPGSGIHYKEWGNFLLLTLRKYRVLER